MLRRPGPPERFVRLMVPLRRSVAERLREMAHREQRDVTHQAAFLLTQALGEPDEPEGGTDEA